MHNMLDTIDNVVVFCSNLALEIVLTTALFGEDDMEDLDKCKALANELDKLDPNTIKGLAWQIIKAEIKDGADFLNTHI